jgi:hypothetical protein
MDLRQAEGSESRVSNYVEGIVSVIGDCGSGPAIVGLLPRPMLLHLDVGSADHFAPLFSVISNDLAEIGR